MRPACPTPRPPPPPPTHPARRLSGPMASGPTESTRVLLSVRPPDAGPLALRAHRLGSGRMAERPLERADALALIDRFMTAYRHDEPCMVRMPRANGEAWLCPVRPALAFNLMRQLLAALAEREDIA